MDAQQKAADVAAIYNACWWVRHYNRGGRIAALRIYRTQAIQKLGLTCREAFNRADDFEPVLTALVGGLRPNDEQPF